VLPGYGGHIAGGILDGDDGLVLFGEDDTTVQEGRNNVRHKEMDLCKTTVRTRRKDFFNV